MLALAALVAAWAVVVAASGGVSVLAGGVRLSSRNAWRPAGLALVLAAAALWRATASDRRALLALAGAAVEPRAGRAALGLALASAIVPAIFGTHVAGASDASGYVSQARLWARGQFTRPAPIVSDAPWPDRGRLVAPLGYRPTTWPDELGPTYAPGLPWLMALGSAVVGDPGPYLWTPLAAGLLVAGTFAFAAFEAPRTVALAAALLVAGSLPVLFEAMQTMSDLPAAALWIWALVGLRAGGRAATVGAGGLAAMALAVRPNLVLGAAAVWAAALVADEGPIADRGRRAVVRAIPLTAVAAAIAALNTRLWGSPVVSGYGAAGELFSTATVGPNLVALWAWTVETRGYWSALGLVALIVVAASPGGRRWWPAVGLVAGVFASYLPYARFADWWYLRFYLPVWPIAAAAVVLAAWRLLARWSDTGGRLALAAAAATLAVVGAADADARGVFDLWRGEQRYAAVCRWVAGHAPPTAVVLAEQHSGSLAYYTDRPVVRFDEVPSDGLDALCERLVASGHAMWLVVEDWEEPAVRARFASTPRGRLDWAPIAEARVGGSRVRVYDLMATTRATGPAFIVVTAGGPWPWQRRAPLPAQ